MHVFINKDNASLDVIIDMRLMLAIIVWIQRLLWNLISLYAIGYQHSVFFTGRMPFLTPNQWRQSTEGTEAPYHHWVVGCWRDCLERGADMHMPSWCHCHSLSLASVKSRLVLPFWYWLTRAVLDKGPLNVCVNVCAVGYQLYNPFAAYRNVSVS